MNYSAIVRIVLFILFALYEIWAFKNRKSITIKLLLMFIMIMLSLLMLAVSSMLGHVIYYIIFAFLVIEFSITSAMVVTLAEIFLSLLGSRRNYIKAILLLVTFLLLVIIYYLVQRIILQ